MNTQSLSIAGISDDKKNMYMAVMILLLVYISWSGVLDIQAYDYLDTSLLSALSSYGVSRALNGIISVLQSSTLSVGIASVSVGELLDPINDIIERFSGLLTLSIASIILQKVLLNIVSSAFFKILLSVSGLSLLISLNIKATPNIKLLSRVFIFLVFLRLALSLMIMLNSFVDNSFLATQIKMNHANINTETKALDVLKDQIIRQNQSPKELEKTLAETKKQQQLLDQKLAILNNQKNTLEIGIRERRVEIEKIYLQMHFVERYIFLSKDKILKIAESDLAEKQQQWDIVKQSIASTKAALQKFDFLILGYEKTQAEKSTGLIEGIKNMAGFLHNNSMETVRQKLVQVRENLDFIVNSLLDLMTLYIIKTVLFPILFMYLLIKVCRILMFYEAAVTGLKVR